MVETPSSGFFPVGVSGRSGPRTRRMAPAGAARTIRKARRPQVRHVGGPCGAELPSVVPRPCRKPSRGTLGALSNLIQG